MLLTDREEINVFELFRGTAPEIENYSLLDLIPRCYRRMVTPCTRNSVIDEDIKQTITGIIDEVIPLVMWMVYFGTGCPYQ